MNILIFYIFGACIVFAGFTTALIFILSLERCYHSAREYAGLIFACAALSVIWPLSLLYLLIATIKGDRIGHR